MSMQIEMWQLLTGLGGLLAAFITCVWAIAKVMGRQIDKWLGEKFAAQEAARVAGAQALRDAIERYASTVGKTAEQLRALENDFLRWQAELPLQYVRREDYVRGQTVIEAKLDALYNKLEVVQMKGFGNG